MTRLTIILIGFGLQFLTHPVRSQVNDSTDSTFERMGNLYLKHSPLDYLEILRDDFKRKGKWNVFVVVTSPENWVREEHIPELLKLIYCTDSTKSVVSVYSSYLSIDKFSSVGREAQNLIECFRAKERYPISLNSFGPPDKTKGRELEDWWIKYKPGKP